MSEPRRVLVVDDDESIRLVTRMVLADAGFDVGTAASGREALRALGGGGYDLVLLDINMPDMDGWQTLRALKADAPARDLPVVLFSVKGELRDKIHGMQEGAADYVTKPFVAEDLVARVRRLLEESRSGESGAARPEPTR